MRGFRDALLTADCDFRAALPTILNIFALWVILFLTFALFYTEIFGLTRWVTQGTSVANYYSFASTLVMLALQSTGCVRRPLMSATVCEVLTLRAQ